MSIPFLLSPGPVAIPGFVQQAISSPPIHHRTENFQRLYGELLEDLQYLFQTNASTLTMIGSGTLGMEAAMYSLLQAGQKVLVLDNGKFSKRWLDYAKHMKLDIYSLSVAWGEDIKPRELVSKLKVLPKLDAIIITHSETSTGIMLELEEMAFQIRRIQEDCLIIVDGITSVGTMPFYFDGWDLDLAITASQKALMNPAGLVAYALSERAVHRLTNTHPADGQNLLNYLTAAKEKSYPYTPPTQLLLGIKAALTYIRNKGLPLVWNETYQSASVFREGLNEMGAKLLGNGLKSPSLSAFYFEEKDMEDIRIQMEKAGYYLSGGQGSLKGQINRISHMGLCDTRHDEGSDIKISPAYLLTASTCCCSLIKFSKSVMAS